MKSPTKSLATDTTLWQENNLPQIPANEIFVPDKEDEGKAPFRTRASTIGNGQIPRYVVLNLNFLRENAKNVKKLCSTLNLLLEEYLVEFPEAPFGAKCLGDSKNVWD